MLRVEGVCAGYGGVERLSDVGARLVPGKLVGLIGPNGSGKSTLLKVLAGQLPPTKGAVLVDGTPMAQLPPKALARRVGYMPQDRGAPSMAVRQMVAHGRYPHLGFGRTLGAADWRAVDRAMALAGVSGCADRPVLDLSGGERQRAYLAMLLAQDAPYVLLDEPTAHLDLRHQFGLMALLRQLAASGKCVVAAVHDLGLALAYCDQLLVLDGGRARIFAPPDQVYASGLIGRVFGVSVEKIGPARYLFGCAPGDAPV